MPAPNELPPEQSGPFPSEEWKRIRKEKKIRDISSLRNYLNTRALNALWRADISIPEALSLSNKELQAIRGIGIKQARKIRQALTQYLGRLPPETQRAIESEALELQKARDSSD